MKRLVAVSAVASVTVFGGPSSAAFADPSPTTIGCNVVATKYLVEEAPGHEGVSHAAEQGTGEGPCGFGNPPGEESG